jgi:hypothetical protein
VPDGPARTGHKSLGHSAALSDSGYMSGTHRTIARGGVTVDIDHRTGVVVLRCDRHHLEYVVLLGTDTFGSDVIQFFETHDGCADEALRPAVASA